MVVKKASHVLSMTLYLYVGAMLGCLSVMLFISVLFSQADWMAVLFSGVGLLGLSRLCFYLSYKQELKAKAVD